MGHLAEAVSHTEDDCIIMGGREASDKLQGDVGPGSVWNQESLKKSCRCQTGSLVLVADGPSLDKIMGVILQVGPPKALEEEVSCMLGTWMTSQFG